MMGIIEENTYSFEDINHKQITALYKEIEGKIYASTRELKDETGICGMNRLGGLYWKRIKINALKPGAPLDYIIVSLTWQLIKFRLTLTLKNKRF